MEAVSHKDVRTLAVDCGGGGIKTTLLDAGGFQIGPAHRTEVIYPFSPEALLEIIASDTDFLAQVPGLGREPGIPLYDRITVGMPGMIRHGKVIYTPHYIRRSGPHTRIDPENEAAWNGLDIQAALEERFGVPALVINDSEVAAAGVISGEGLEVVLTFGTGLGSAIVDNGVLAPHLEISHAQMRWGLTYDDVVGEIERIRLGDAAWSRRVLRAVDSLFPVIRWDKLYIGGGNAARITPTVRARFDSRVTFIPNAAGMNGGVRAWSLARRRERPARG
ncbi:ROK family protein [Actinobaculum suis]|uniref:ROK family protein n=1 Tax=Actinobaculum suis TaxID=1657 RepID=UPI00163C3D42|nr:ROK family protein [Actinobaculum suis]